MVQRFDAYPQALKTLAGWQDMGQPTRVLICHWHLQLSDPLYRRFTGEFLVAQRAQFGPTITREQVIRWLDKDQPGRWSLRTRQMFASKLIGAARQAKLIEGRHDPCQLVWPRVPDAALGYLIHLLNEVDFAGTIADNPYLRSVGLSDKFLDDRLRTLPGITWRRMGDLLELRSDASDLLSWGAQFRHTTEV